MKKFTFPFIFSILLCLIKSQCPFRGQNRLLGGREPNSLNNNQDYNDLLNENNEQIKFISDNCDQILNYQNKENEQKINDNENDHKNNLQEHDQKINDNEHFNNLEQSTVVTNNKQYNAILIISITDNYSLLIQQIERIQNIPAALIQLQKNSKSDPDQNPSITPPLPEVPNLTPDQEILAPIQIGIGFETRYWSKIRNLKNLKHHHERKGKFGVIPDSYYKNLIAFHLKADSRSLNFLAIQEITTLLDPIIHKVIQEVHGFRNFDSRGIDGFIDGTVNLQDMAKRRANVLNEFGGSIMLSQIWQINLESWNSISIKEQETVIGRTKHDSVELDPPSNTSHVARMSINDTQGNQIFIYRQSAVFGNINDKNHGLNYISYSSNVEKQDEMLDKMTGNTEDGLNDDSMQFRTCVFSNYFYVPSRKQLQNLHQELYIPANHL